MEKDFIVKWRISLIIGGGFVIVFLLFLISALIVNETNINLAQFSVAQVAKSIIVNQEIPLVPEPVVREKSTTHIVKGIYLTASSANNLQKMNEMIDLIDKTELNAVVIDIKDYTGYILYDSQVPEVKKFETKRIVMKDVSALINKLHEKNIYVIARQTVFQDPILAQRQPDWAIKNKQGGVWHDYKGLSWVDGTRQEIWDYNIAIAKEAIMLGFDEVNFDYVRFPTDGNTSLAVMPSSSARSVVMKDFFNYLSNGLKDEPAYISLDFFGFVMERHDGMAIGQKLEDAVDVVDYISPMMYPSHYPNGHLGLENPAANPGPVIDNGMKLGVPYFENKRALVRPWLQAFNIGAVYGEKNIRAQIDMVEKYPNAGWLLWNAVNRYGVAGLKLNDIE